MDVKITKEGLFTLKMIHVAMISGVVLFLFVVLFLINDSGGLAEGSKKDFMLFYYLAPILALVGYFYGKHFFRNHINTFKQDPSSDMPTAYQTAFIIRLALLEGPALFGVISLMLSEDLFFLAVIIPMVLVMVSYSPTKEKIKREIEMS